MAWAPTTSFEKDLVAYQPDFNFIHGQLADELKRKKEFSSRPKATFEDLPNRKKRDKEIESVNPSKSEEIRDSLAMMERIQQISGTKPLGEHASMSDWDDTSTVEKEAVAMMRHFGMMSMADGGKLDPPKPKTLPQEKIHISRKGSKTFPFITDPAYFEPGRKRKDSYINNSTNGSSDRSTDSIYFSAASQLDDTHESLLPSEPKLPSKQKQWSRPSQTQGRKMIPKNRKV